VEAAVEIGQIVEAACEGNVADALLAGTAEALRPSLRNGFTPSPAQDGLFLTSAKQASFYYAVVAWGG